MKSKELPSQEYLQECFDYNPESGKLYWKERPRKHFKCDRGWKVFNSKFPGKLALNSSDSQGYLTGGIDNSVFKAHRVIWKLIYGEEPENILHFNGNLKDNRIEKLSVGPQSENMLDKKQYKNNNSGTTGVSWDEGSKKWRVYIFVNGKNKFLGRFEILQDAIETRKNANVKYNYNENHGRQINCEGE